MLRKLYATVSGACCADNPDSPQHQEVLLPGSLYGMIIKERMEEILNNIRTNISLDVRNGAAVDFNDSSLFPLLIPPKIYNIIQNDISPKFCQRSTLTSVQNSRIFSQLATSFRQRVLICNKPLVSR